jgi:hypothetical protein
MLSRLNASSLLVIFFGCGLAASAQTAAKIENELLAHLNDVEKYSNYRGSPDADRLEKANAQLKAAIIKFGTLPVSLTYAFLRLKDKMYIATSRDGKFRVYSWDRDTGGSMHDFDNVFQFRGRSGRVRTWTAPRKDETGAGEFYSQVFQVDTPMGRVYLANGNGIYSTSLAGQSLGAYSIEGESLVPDVKIIRTRSGMTGSIHFSYDFFSVVDHPERPVKLFFYNDAKKSFRFPVVIEDRKTPQGRVTDKYITYRFDGKLFVKVS